MSLQSDLKELQRKELYVGVFHNRLWTYKSLCDYFHRLIKGSIITECHFYPCTNPALDDHSFAILTFASISSVDQCLAKHDEIKQEHRLIVKRNLRDKSKEQRSISKCVLIHIHKFERTFNKQNVLTYFGKYGTIIEWKILDNGRTFLLCFEAYDSVDRILLDQPHFVNEQSLSIRKCYNPYTITLTYSYDSRLKEQICNLQTAIDRSTYSHESNLIKRKNQIAEEILVEENRLSDTMKSCIRIERIQRDLKQNIIDTRQINQQLKNQLQESVQKSQRIVDEFENQLEQQRSINKSVQESILNFAQLH